ncbi:hypothetical protein NPX13_g8583 [Xylaria arbuscula]|uniref:Uncharacterized protein n=1 Tax=Xylaria arbuscula TaxID=114810 RepID=A0A9W8TJP6_9PEZI|nr:hypothetical protein NPX13_g8583 [Xylaria arbuscula]
MDAFKNLGNQGQDKTNQTANAAAGQKDDYGDKAAQFLNKKYNNNSLDKSQLEKITDGAREGFEKLTGKDVPDKFSN